MKIVAVVIIQNFHTEALEDYVIVPELFINLQMKNGLMVNVRKREKHGQCCK